jgi:hypothetical protein
VAVVVPLPHRVLSTVIWTTTSRFEACRLVSARTTER